MSDAAGWYKDAIIYELHVRAFHDSDGDGIGDFRGLTEKLDYLQDLGVTASGCCRSIPRRSRTTATTSPTTPTSTRYGTLEDFKDVPARGAPARAPRHHRAGHQPHLRPAPLVPARPARARPAAAGATSTSGATRRTSTRRPASSSRTSSPPTGPGTRWPRRTTGTASTPISPTSTSTTPTSTRRCSRSSTSGWSMGVDGLRLDAVPYLYEREGTNCENLPETHAFLKELRQHVDEKFHEPHAAGRGQPVAGGRRRLLRRAATSATWRSTSR